MHDAGNVRLGTKSMMDEVNAGCRMDGAMLEPIAETPRLGHRLRRVCTGPIDRGRGRLASRTPCLAHRRTNHPAAHDIL